MEAIYDFPAGEVVESVSLISGALDVLYYPIPCSPVSPFVGAGLAGIYFKPKNAFESNLNDNFLEYQMNIRAGVEWEISSKWRVVTEAGYFTPSSNKLDGENNTHEHKGLFGTNCDTYMSFNLGFLFYFSEGNPSTICDNFSGITVGSPLTNQLTAEDVEKIVKDNLPKEIVKEVIVEKPLTEEKRWILVGVNFEFGSATLTKESFPILLNAMQVLTDHPEMKIEIQGHTDNVGSESFNMMLSQRRANVVLDYLVANGISESRLVAKGYGESMPIADNNLDEGRTLNRRIEFKIR
ncbi:MAG: OmpA family protein [Ignavibacteriaceae bacterium]|nr:OmpA family protein [Ignavibacteriaceae bacterium]